MPDSNGKLRRFIKSKNSFVERYLASVVHIIKTSLLNAHAFEDISKDLKRAHREKVSYPINSSHPLVHFSNKCFSFKSFTVG